MRLIVRTCLVLALVLSLVLSLGLPAASMAEQQNGPSLEDVVKGIKSNSNVRVLSAERVTVDDQPKFKIKILTKGGRVKTIWVNAGE